MDQETPIAELRASSGRRIFAVLAIFSLGGLLIFAALRQPPALGWQIFLILLGGGALVLGDQLRRATLVSIQLFPDAVRDSDGAVLARLDEIAKVERGVFAFKPSNGFVLHLHQKGARAWAPGLWWRIGRRVGVGGVVPAGAAKFMADQIAMSLKTDQ